MGDTPSYPRVYIQDMSDAVNILMHCQLSKEEAETVVARSGLVEAQLGTRYDEWHS